MKIRHVSKIISIYDSYRGIYARWDLLKGLDVDDQNPIIKAYESNKIR